MEIKLSCRLDYCARHLYKLDCANVKMDCAKTNINVESDYANVKIYATALSIYIYSRSCLFPWQQYSKYSNFPLYSFCLKKWRNDASDAIFPLHSFCLYSDDSDDKIPLHSFCLKSDGKYSESDGSVFYRRSMSACKYWKSDGSDGKDGIFPLHSIYPMP